MRARLIAFLVVLALVAGGAILLANAGGGGGSTTTAAPPTTVPPPTVAPTTTTTVPPTTTTVTAPPPTTAAPTTVAAPPFPAGCHLIDDARGVLVVFDEGEERDVGQIIDSSTGDPPRGGRAGDPSQLEALALDRGTGRYYVTSWGLLGTLDVDTARFTEVGDTGLRDVDGLAFDPDGTLYAVARVADAPDRLLVIDPATGEADDIGPVTGPGVLEDVDDLAFDPGTGALYAVTNHDEELERTSVLVTIDPADATAMAIGNGLGIVDGEGLTFADGNQLWVTTGQRGGSALFLVDLDAGTAEGIAVLGGGMGDYEAIACPNGRS